MRAIRLLNLSRLRTQPLRALLGVVAIAAGTALFTGVLIDQSSVNWSVDRFVQQRAGAAQLEVHGPGGPAGLDASVLPKVEAVPGVAAAAPIVQVVTIVEDGAGTERYVAAFGVDCRIEAVLGDFGCSDELLVPNAFALSPRLAEWLGPNGVLRTDEGRLPVANGFPVELLDEMNNGNMVVVSLAEAQRLFGHDDALTSILVVPDDGVSLATLETDLEAVVGEQNLVGDPGTIGPIEMATMFISMLMLMSLFALAIGAQLVRNTVALTLEERRRDLAVVGAIGASRRTLLLGTLAESAFLGALGGLLGIAGGMVLARPLVNGMSNSLDEMSGLQLSVHVSSFAIVAGILLGVATSVYAAFRPAWRAASMDVAAELHGQARRDETVAAARGRRALLYAALALAGAAIAWIGQREGAIEPWQPTAAYAGFGMTALLSFRAAQHAAAPLLNLAQQLPFLRNGPARLAMANLAGEPKRAGVMVMALAAAAGIGIVLGNVNGSIVDGATEVSNSIQGNALYVSTVSANNSLGIEAKMSDALIERVRAVEGVGAVSGENGFCGWHPSIDQFCVSAETDRTTFDIFRGRDSVAEVFENGEILIGPGLARSTGARPGDELKVPGRTGMRTMTVGAIWADPDNIGRGITMSSKAFDEMYGERPTGGLRVEPAPGVTLEELDARIEGANLDPDLVSFDPDELADDVTGSIMGFVTPFAALQRGMLVVALVAITSTLLLVSVQRRREHGLLMAVGMAPPSLGQMVLTEAGMVGVAATVLGTIAGTVTYVAIMWVSPLFTGLSAPFHFDLTAPLLYGGIGLVFVLVGAALPAWRTSRLDPALALRYE